MMSHWIALIVVLSSRARFSDSFAPAVSNPRDRESMTRGTQIFQSSIALQNKIYQKVDSCSRNRCSQVIEMQKLDAINIAYSPTSNGTTVTTQLDTNENYGGIQAEEQLTVLRSKSLKELKLTCSRRNVRYGKFLEKEEYIDAIWQDMKKAFAFSVTGLVQPGAMVELTEEQLEREIFGKESLILVDAFARWCGPCRVIIPQLEMTAKKLVDDKVRVVKIDVDKHPSWAARYQVEGLPTILLIQGGCVLGHLEGTYTTDEIFNFVQQYIEES